jgi:predicted nucleic acid-binding protein
MIVLDASALLDFLLRSPAGRRVAARIAPEGETLHAPHLVDLEVAQVLRRLCAAGHISPARAIEALTDFLDLDLHRYPHDALLPRIWDLRENFTAYDAAYLALTEALGATLLTSDGAMAAPTGVAIAVEHVGS